MAPEDDQEVNDRIAALEVRLDRLERAVTELRETIQGLQQARSFSAPPLIASPDSTSKGKAPVDEDGEEDEGAPAPTASADRSSSGPESVAGESATRRLSQSPTRSQKAGLAAKASGDASASAADKGGRSFIGLRSEDWLSYVGIGLLLFGLAFLFKYTIEQGWLIPEVRVGFGLLTGSVLFGMGVHVYNERRRLRQVFLGGSSATFYGTVFAAYQLYGLLPYSLAFGSMVTITVVSIAVALRQDEASMAVLGTLGGLGTPFLLYAEVTSVAGLAGYTCIVLGGACAVYLYRGWRSLLYTAIVGGWVVLLIPALETTFTGDRPTGAWALQVGLVVAWMLLGGVPVVRAVLRKRWSQSRRLGAASLPRGQSIFAVVTASPFLALLGTRLLWSGPDLLWAGVAAGGALGYAAAYRALRRVPLPQYASAHGLVAVVLLTYGLSEALGGVTLLVAWAVEAALLLVLASRLGEASIRRAGHVLFWIVGGWLGMRLATPEPDLTPLVSAGALSELLAGALGSVAVWATTDRVLRRLYRGALVVGWFAWWANELLPLPQGPTYLLLVGSGSAAVLLALGRRYKDSVFRIFGHLAFAVLAAGLIHRFLQFGRGTPPIWGLAPLSEMAVLGLALGASRLVERRPVRLLYQGGVLAGWLAWWAHHLLRVPNGQAYVSLVWGTTAAFLLALGAGRRWADGQTAGLATLALFVGKLFLVDLAALPALWRIALFLGAGGGFLLISYALPETE